MEKRKVYLALTILLMLALLLPSCSKKVTSSVTTSAVTTTTTTTASGSPQYGGNITVWCRLPFDQFDDCFTGAATDCFSSIVVNNRLIDGDWAKGPAGIGETDFWLGETPMPQDTGSLTTNWEFPDPNTIIFHIRPGVHWAVDPNNAASQLVNGRELTADDVAFNITRNFNSDLGNLHTSSQGWFVSATATDKYTVTVTGKDSETTRTYSVFLAIGFIEIYPPEVINKYGDMRDWKNSCGTGAYMLTNYTAGVSYTFNRNPNYWAKDPAGPGKGNQLPYLDGFSGVIIQDFASQLAAIRTHQIDWINNIGLDDGRSLQKSNPELIFKKGLYPNSEVIPVLVNDPTLPTYQLNVRKALQMAIDLQGITNQYYGGDAEALAFPVPSNFKDNYTPIDQLPASTKENYTYDPVKAKQLLTDAGYPQGFNATILTWNNTAYINQINLVQAAWSKINVNLQISNVEAGVYWSTVMGHKYKSMLFFEQPFGSQMRFISTIPWPYTWNLSGADDPIINQVRSSIWSYENINNPTEKAKLTVQGVQEELAMVYYIALPTPDAYCFWTPWVKNYHGEQLVGDSRTYTWVQYVWDDQNLKKQITGQ